MFKKLNPAKSYRLLESGPIVLVTTRAGGKNNVMTLGFHMMMQHEPALVGCIIGPWDYSYQALRETGECVIALPTVDLAQQVVDIGNCSGEEVDKFRRFGLTARSGESVEAPLIRECVANLECRVVDDAMVDRYNMFILQVENVWVDRARREQRLLHHRGDGVFIVDGETIDLGERMVRWRYLMDD
ncbi:flavin reductase family protein [Noviherbaspirillum aridicola]|uniref:Flavin reductase n=1 Tax=Noviherbaspirillum aridicola TaxID=2849687 RepID=A0ABQ4PZG0_9BURK|nr:flavin reductase family protein [Noviherbaspirillum aridicola]GIZ50295.1 flavin reductase [Noviherbaspirillum aridicola]